MGHDCYSIFEHLDVAEQKNKKNPAVILEKLGEYIKPKRNVTYERFTFNMAKQAKNESFEDFLNRILRVITKLSPMK